VVYCFVFSINFDFLHFLLAAVLLDFVDFGIAGVINARTSNKIN